MATGMQINNIAIPSPMDERGLYLFDLPALGRNGRGAAIAAPGATLRWDFVYMTPDEYAWWVTTLLDNALSAEFTQCKFFNHKGVLTAYTHCIVLRPTYDHFRDGVMNNVAVMIDWIY